MECKDRNCPRHGSLSTRGSVLDGEVVSDKMQGTVIVRRDRMIKVKKYDRYRRQTSKIPAHNPPCIDAKTGDKVRIMECRKLSRTVSFTVIGKLGAKDDPGQSKKTAKKTVKKSVKKQSEEQNNG
jgi:small subunit ribosomal protein S17